MKHLPPSPYFNNNETILAGTLFGEARGCSVEEMEDVAQVIINRTSCCRGGRCVADVCLAPLQFSSWNLSDPNRQKILAAPKNDPKQFQACLDVAKRALAGQIGNRVGGACNYYDKTLDSKPPFWARPPAVMTLKTEHFRFFKNC